MAIKSDELREKFAPGKGDYVAMMTIGYPKITPRAPARKEGRFDII